MRAINYKKYNNRIKRFLKVLEDQNWSVDPYDDVGGDIKTEFLKIFRLKKPKKKAIKEDCYKCKGVGRLFPIYNDGDSIVCYRCEGTGIKR